MKFKKLYIEGAYSFPILDFNFENQNPGISIILGKNLDQNTNNGAGKSTLLKSLYLMLYGKDLNGANIDKAIGWSSKGGFAGYLEFEDRGSNFRITRYRKSVARADGVKNWEGTPVSGNGVDFMMDGSPLNGETHTETQSIIESKIRISSKLFLSSVLMAQDSQNNFLKANDTDKKEILSELLDLMEYSKAFEKVKKEIKNSEEKLKVCQLKIENERSNISKIKDRIKGLKDEEVVWNKGRINEINLINNSIKSYLIKLKELDKKLKDADLSKIKIIDEKIALNKKEIDSLELKVEKEDLIKSNKNDLESHIKLNKNNFKNISSLLIDLNSRLKSIEIKDFSPINLDELKRKKENLLDLKNKEEIKKEVINKNNNQIKINNLELKRLSLDIETKDEDIAKLKSGTCSSCEQDVTEDHLEQLLKKRNEEKDIIKENIAELTSQNSKLLEAVNVEILSFDSQISSAEEELKNAEIFNGKIDLEIKNNENKKNDVLKIKEEISNKRNEVSEIEKNIKKEEEELKTLDLGVKKLNEEKELLKEKVAIENKLTREKSVIEKDMASLDVLSSQRAEYKSIILKEKSKLDKLKSEKNPFEKVKESLLSDLDINEKILKNQIDSSIEVEEELKYLNFWKKGFSPTGIRSFIIDDVIDLLNMKTQENLNDLFDGALNVVFEPESKGKKGVTSNKIDTKFYLNGNETSFEMLSGGEKQRGVLAVDLALTEIAESRAGITLNLKFLDEPFNGIDSAGQMKSLALFSRLAKRKDGFYIISHDEKFQNLCQNGVYILKKNGISQFVDRERFEQVAFSDEEADRLSQKQIEAKGKKRKRKVTSLKVEDEQEE